MTTFCFGPWALLQYWFFPALLPLECWAELNRAMEPTDVGLIRYLTLFALTVGLEYFGYWPFLRRFKNLKQLFGINLFLNAATHPAVTFLFPILAARAQVSTAVYLTAAEGFAPAVEALLLVLVCKIPPKRAIISAVVANLLSWGIGLKIVE